MKKLILALSIAAASFSVNASWFYKEHVDLMTDVDKSYVAAIANKKAALVRCGESNPEMMFKFDYLGKANTITFRFDKESPFNLYSNTKSTDGTGVFLHDSFIPKIVELMKKHEKMAVQTTDYRGTIKQAVFDLNGFTREVSKLKCLK